MPWTCEQTEDRLLDAFEGALSAAAKAEMEAHVAACAGCAALERNVRQTIVQLRQLEAAEPAPWLEAKILAQTAGPKPARRRRFGLLDLVWQPGFALGVLAVLITVSLVVKGASSAGSVSLGSVSPIEMVRQIDRRAHLAYAHGVKFLSDLRVVYEIQSRFQSQPDTVPARAPEKRSLGKSDRLLYGRIDRGDVPARLLPAHPTTEEGVVAEARQATGFDLRSLQPPDPPIHGGRSGMERPGRSA